MDRHASGADTDSSSKEPSDPLTNGERDLRTLGLAAGYRSLLAIARAAGINRKTLVDACRGQRPTAARTIGKIAMALHVSVDTVAHIVATARREFLDAHRGAA